ncbi:MAG: VanZ family protein [Syntrophus sp. (in: bacteria)]|nr:VanZ family protein [Syntrophus sp. (in: bacteria)]
MILVCTVIYMSLAPLSLSMIISFPQSDKALHFAAYTVTMFWFSQIYPKKPASLLIASGLIMLGILLEFIQGATGYRTFEYLDMTANTLGVILGLYLAQTRLGGLFCAIERCLSPTRG